MSVSAHRKQITPHLVRFNKVVFRCSNELKKELRYMKVERADEPSRLKGYTEEKRKTNILNYIQQNNTISTLECRSINGCSKYIALKDLRTLLDEQKDCPFGVSRQCTIWPKNQGGINMGVIYRLMLTLILSLHLITIYAENENPFFFFPSRC